MNLKDFLESRDKSPELYWSLVLEAGWVQAGIWYIGDTKAEVVSIGPGASWETEEELLGAADAALSSAIAKLPDNAQEPNKTVFGVPSSWVKGGEITDEYLAKIKTLCTELSLNPVGFVVLPEAIAHLYKSEESSPVSAIILGLGKENLEISVFKLGNLAGTTQVSRSVSLIEDITEGLSRFEGAAPLPSRFIIFDGKEAELNEAKEAIMQESWEGIEKISFLHTPKAEILMPDKKVLATSLAGANEIGHVSQVASQEDMLNGQEELQPEEDEVQNIKKPEPNVSAEDLGFAIGEDISQKEKPAVVPTAPPVVHAAQVPLRQPFRVNDYVAKTKSAFHNFIPKSIKTPKVGNKSWITLGIAALIAIVVAGAAWWFLPKAKVTIYVTPKDFQQNVDMTFNTSGQSDPANGVIPAQTVTAQVSGEKTKSATGSKLIGDKAKGSVQIQNGTAFPINLTAGTILVSSANLKFDLDQAASVSAALSPSSPGTATLSVTADAIGADYNLAKDEVFKIGNYPKAEVDATAVADFSGGSSQQISAVSKDDQTALETALKDELSGTAKDQLTSKVTDTQVLLDDLAGLDIGSETFDHKVGDQADSVKLNLTLNTTGVAADRTKLLEYARAVLKDKIPNGYALRDSQINFKFTYDSTDGDNIKYKAQISANFLPQVNTTDIINNILGRTPTVTQNYLTSIPGFTRADITLSPSLPGPLGTLPHMSKNITVEISAER